MSAGKPEESSKFIFEKLPPGPTKKSAEERAKHQGERLMRAMVEAVANNGFPATTLREVVALAGVSNRTFYEHFDSMQECFLAAFEEISIQVAEQSALAFMAQENFPKRMEAILDAYLATIVSEPQEAHLMLVDLISLGAEGVARRQQVAGAFEMLINQSFAEEPDRDQISPLGVRGIVGGIQRIAYRRVQNGEIERLEGDFEEILGWALSYLRTPGVELSTKFRGRAVSATLGEREEPDLEGEWDEPQERARLQKLDKHERIIRAATTVAGERGYASLSIPAITRAARISNNTFYEHFTSTEEAFFAAIDTLGARLLRRVRRALEEQQSWENRVEAGLEALLVFLAEKPGLAHLVFIEALAAGPPTLGRVDTMLDGLAQMFGLYERPGPKGAPLSPVVVESIAGGPFFIVQREISEHRMTSLPELLPELSAFVLAPYGRT